MSNRLLNYLLYQAGWCAGLYGAVTGHPAAGAAAGVGAIALHIVLARRRADECALVLGAAVMGLIVDGVQIAMRGIAFVDAGVVAGVPLWLIVLWAQFGTTFRFSLHWVSARPWRVVAFGVVGGPLAYLGGARLGAVRIGEPVWASLLVMAGLWALAMPVLTWVSRRTEGLPGVGAYRWP